MSKQRAFEVSVLKAFTNFHVLKHFIVISETMPQPSDLKLKNNEEILEVKEIYAEVVINESNQNSRTRQAR